MSKKLDKMKSHVLAQACNTLECLENNAKELREYLKRGGEILDCFMVAQLIEDASSVAQDQARLNLMNQLQPPVKKTRKKKA